MKIVHLMRKEKFTSSVSQFYNKYFNNGEHDVLYINTNGENSLIDDNLNIMQKELFISSYMSSSKDDIKTVLDAIEQYDYIVFHSLFINGPLLKKMAMTSRIRKKIVWIEWGYDLFDWKVKVNSIRARAYRYYGRIIRSRCNSFVAILPNDIEYYKKRFPKATAEIFTAPYCGPDIPDHLKNHTERCQLTESRNSGEPIYIQIGNRAYRKLNHMKVLDQLARFKDENIKLLIPLSYGSTKYADMVQSRAEELFPGKTICLREFMPEKEYFELLNRVDIAIISSHRQIALGNIYCFIINNAKIYMPEQSELFSFFTEKGVPIQKCEDLDGCTFDELISDYIIEDEDAYNSYIDRISNMNQNVADWRYIYDNLRKKVEGKR